MSKFVFATLLLLLLSGCATNPIPEGYQGPLANVSDSVSEVGSTSANFFYVSRFNGQRIDQSLAVTTQANAGRGFALTPKVIARDLPAAPSKLTIVGRTHYAAPILELTGTVYQVTGDIMFNPVANRSYVVKGTLGPQYSAIWVEDVQTGEVMDRKVEVMGSAALGAFEK